LEDKTLAKDRVTFFFLLGNLGIDYCAVGLLGTPLNQPTTVKYTEKMKKKNNIKIEGRTRRVTKNVSISYDIKKGKKDRRECHFTFYTYLG
jgi:hypothetical protein